MNVLQVLKIPTQEIDFHFPKGAQPARCDPKYPVLQVERRGLRQWDSFEERPSCLHHSMMQQTNVPVDWRPYINEWDRFAASELNVADLLKKTLLQRVNIALDAASPGTSIIGTPRHFAGTWPAENGAEGEYKSNRIAPDLMVVDGHSHSTTLEDLQRHIVVVGDIKVQPPSLKDDTQHLPGTTGCFESWLAQPVHYCISLNIPFGFVLTNEEVVLFQLIRNNKTTPGGERNTRSSSNSAIDERLLANSSEAEYSSPIVRHKHHWVRFHEGDFDVPLLEAPVTPKRTPDEKLSAQRAPVTPKRTLDEKLSTPPSRHAQRFHMSGVMSSPSMPSSPPDRVANDPDYSPDEREGQLSHVLIRSYSVPEDEDVGVRLFEFIMLAQRVKEKTQLNIGPFKRSNAALLQ